MGCFYTTPLGLEGGGGTATRGRPSTPPLGVVSEGQPRASLFNGFAVFDLWIIVSPERGLRRSGRAVEYGSVYGPMKNPPINPEAP